MLVTQLFQRSAKILDYNEHYVDVGIDCNIGPVYERKLLPPLTNGDVPQKITPFIYQEKVKRCKSDELILKEQVFATGTKYVGEWLNHNMDGMCSYVFPNGAVFEGNLYKGVFDGDCSIYYPHGGIFKGVWFEGKLERWEYMFSDGLVYSSENDWEYLKKPDRRFWTEIRCGLKPGGAEQITNKVPADPVPEGLYDTGFGFYNPRDLSISHPVTGEFMRVPSASEIKWILKNCRKGGITHVGFQKDLYRNWFSDDDNNDEISIPDFSGVKWIRPEKEPYVNRFRKLYKRNKLDANRGIKYRMDIFPEDESRKRDVETMAREKVTPFKANKDFSVMCQKWNTIISGEVLMQNFDHSKDKMASAPDDALIPLELTSCHVTKSEQLLIHTKNSFLMDSKEGYSITKSK